MYTEQVQHWPLLPCASTTLNFKVQDRCAWKISIIFFCVYVQHGGLFDRTCSIWCCVCSHQITHYSCTPCSPYITIFYVCFLSFDQMLLSKDRTGDPWATWVESTFGLAWFYLVRCCLSSLAMQLITSNSKVLRRGLCIFSPKSFCDRHDYYHREHVCCFSLR